MPDDGVTQCAISSSCLNMMARTTTDGRHNRICQRSKQKGNTENIVETEQGGRGAKEYLIEFSEKILSKLNPNIRARNIHREKYREALSPEVAEHIIINRETLQRNNSLKKLGDVIGQFQ